MRSARADRAHGQIIRVMRASRKGEPCDLTHHLSDLTSSACARRTAADADAPCALSEYWTRMGVVRGRAVVVVRGGGGPFVTSPQAHCSLLNNSYVIHNTYMTSALIFGLIL